MPEAEQSASGLFDAYPPPENRYAFAPGDTAASKSRTNGQTADLPQHPDLMLTGSLKYNLKLHKQNSPGISAR